MSNSIAVAATPKIPWYREIGKREWRVFWAAYLGWTLDAMDAMLYSICILSIMKEFNLNTAQGGMLASITFFAAGAGAWLYGILADKIGRKNSLMISILTYAVATGACGLAQSVTQLAILRIIVGFGVGGEWGTGAALVSETWPDKYRARVLGFVQSGFAMGFLLGALIGAFVLPKYGWRMVFYVGFLPALLTLWIRKGIEETDQYKEVKKDQEEGKIKKQSFFEKFAELWTRPYRKATIGVMFYMSFYIFAWWGVITWLNGYLGTPVEKGGAGLSIVKSGLWVAEMQIGAVLGYICFGYIADAIGRKKATVSFLLTAAVMLPIFLTIRQPLWLLVAGPILAFAGYGSAAGQGTISAELYPTRIRGTGQGFMYGCGRFASGFAPYTIGAVALTSGLGTALKMIVPPSLVIAAVAVAFLIRETKGVKIDTIQ